MPETGRCTRNSDRFATADDGGGIPVRPAGTSRVGIFFFGGGGGGGDGS